MNNQSNSIPHYNFVNFSHARGELPGLGNQTLETAAFGYLMTKDHHQEGPGEQGEMVQGWPRRENALFGNPFKFQSYFTILMAKMVDFMIVVKFLSWAAKL